MTAVIPPPTKHSMVSVHEKRAMAVDLVDQPLPYPRLLWRYDGVRGELVLLDGSVRYSVDLHTVEGRRLADGVARCGGSASREDVDLDAPSAADVELVLAWLPSLYAASSAAEDRAVMRAMWRVFTDARERVPS